MSTYIEVGDRFVVTSDQFQFILQEKKTAKSGKNAGKEWLGVVGYYPTISRLVSGLILHGILTGEAASFAEIGEQVERIGQQCQAAFSANGR
ncbi:DUF5405 family protein [Citrobacter freundii]|uniref:DUF5405 family protein n=1 Tax=Citrobacter freundii TaxID=546 RepID=UPI0015E9AFFA|nr:DUF5405 family protein [Citrobacter freundii]QLY68924.1 DUF5405 family protein [Citrobacter freundii]HCT4276538.1 DUF5405 family protein [Citrobacter freundii]